MSKKGNIEKGFIGKFEFYLKATKSTKNNSSLSINIESIGARNKKHRNLRCRTADSI